MGATSDFTGTPLEGLAGDGMFDHFRRVYNGPLLSKITVSRTV
jgi:N-ethylmaleimide reductase